MQDVVGVAPAGGDVASGVGTALVSQFEEPAQAVGYHPGGSSHLDRHRLGVEENPADGGITGQAANGVPADRADFGIDDALALSEGVPGKGDQDVGRTPACLSRRLAETAGRSPRGRPPGSGRGCEHRSGSKLAGSDRERRASRTTRPPAGSRSPLTCTRPVQCPDTCRRPHPMEPFRLGLSGLRVGVPLPGRPAPWAPAGKKPQRPGHQSSLVPGELVGGQSLRLSQHLHPGLGHVTGSERPLRVSGICLERLSHRHLAADHRNRLSGEGSEPLGGRTEALRLRGVGAFRLGDPGRIPRFARARSRANRRRPPPIAAGVLPTGSSASVSHAQSASRHTPPIYRPAATEDGSGPVARVVTPPRGNLPSPMAIRGGSGRGKHPWPSHEPRCCPLCPSGISPTAVGERSLRQR